MLPLAAALVAAGLAAGAGASAPGPAPSGPPALPPATAAVAAPVTAVATLERSVPVRLVVPSLGVDTSLVELGLDERGVLEVPGTASQAGWYVGAPTPGERGPAVVVGHVDLDGEPGVLSRLAQLRPGAEVRVQRADGRTAVFRTTRVEQADKDAFPTASVYGDLDHAGLRLITCGGAFSRTTGHYEDNVIAYAELVATA